ncbi:MAG: hypothetical protein JXR95_11390 [Deltaproteobacteria bacterium]|nr:hypothetical protein [Deltaproteobacteria bacterium]
MYNVKVDTAKKCLFITLEGFMQEDEVKKAADLVVSSLPKLPKGFTVVNDISQFKPASREAGEYIKLAQAAIFQKGVSKVIRVTGKSFVGKLQFERTKKEVNATYETVEVATMEDALKLL